MKKNAILVASILFVAGCATNKARYSSTESTNPSLSAQYDPATGGYPSTTSESGYRHFNNTAVNDFHADSSTRGGSNEARGWAQRDFLPTEGTPLPLNPAVQADSSVRGGSNEARNGNFSQSSNDHPLQNPDQDMIDKRTSFDYYVPVPKEPSVASDESIQSSPNWNPSDDLLADGIQTQPSHIATPSPNNDASVGGAAKSESGSASSRTTLDDISAPNPSARDLSEESSDLFRNNRAQGIGSAATGENPGRSAAENLSDSQMAEKVKRTLTRDESGTSGITQREITRNVQVTSHDGLVLLKGAVPSQKAKDMLELRAREISGVRQVENQLTVTSEANPSVRDLNIGRDLEDSSDQIHHLTQ